MQKKLQDEPDPFTGVSRAPGAAQTPEMSFVLEQTSKHASDLNRETVDCDVLCIFEGFPGPPGPPRPPK